MSQRLESLHDSANPWWGREPFVVRGLARRCGPGQIPTPPTSLKAVLQTVRFKAKASPHSAWCSRLSAALRYAFLAWFAVGIVSADSPPVAPVPPTNGPTAIVVVGAAGEGEFGELFAEQTRLWEAACRRAGAGLTVIGLSGTNGACDREVLKQQLASTPTTGLQPLWLVLIGHGTFDGKEARFNARGPDVSATDLADWLKPFTRPLVIVDTTSASAPFLSKLSATNRVVITATRSGNELNLARFGQYFARAIADPQSDLDKDGQTSVLEAFLSASAQVAEFYKTAGRLATEHALIDDNGDGLGTPADWFRGVRAIKKPETGAVDGVRAQQIHLILSPSELALPPAVRARRDALELEVFKLRDAKPTMAEEQYYQRLEALLLELARLQIPGTKSSGSAGGH